MILKVLKPREALNKAFLKVKLNRTEIEGFKASLITLLDSNSLDKRFYSELLHIPGLTEIKEGGKSE